MRKSVVARAERGFLPPRFVLEAVQRESSAFAAANQNVLYTKLDGALAKIPEMDPQEREELLAEMHSLVEEVVRPAYRRLAQTLENSFPRRTMITVSGSTRWRCLLSMGASVAHDDRQDAG